MTMTVIVMPGFVRFVICLFEKGGIYVIVSPVLSYYMMVN